MLHAGDEALHVATLYVYVQSRARYGKCIDCTRLADMHGLPPEVQNWPPLIALGHTFWQLPDRSTVTAISSIHTRPSHEAPTAD